MSNEVLAAVDRVRRAMPRNVDVMLICDAAAKWATPKSKFDRRTYQRELMRKRRAAAKAARFQLG